MSKKLKKMTQEIANEIFEGVIGRQLLMFYATPDGMPFIRWHEAKSHIDDSNENKGTNFTYDMIEEWYPEF